LARNEFPNPSVGFSSRPCLLEHLAYFGEGNWDGEENMMDKMVRFLRVIWAVEKQFPVVGTVCCDVNVPGYNLRVSQTAVYGLRQKLLTMCTGNQLTSM